MTTITFKLEDEFKDAFDSFCSASGITMTNALNMFVHSVVREQRVPFEIAPAYILPENMEKALAESMDIASGKKDFRGFKSAKDMRAAMDAEDSYNVNA